ncbi:hypothetical protein B0H67DRAFT_558139 [Lasiosphaeris hirsuta]|uniref:Uncharacterized protein n=1 Tax=Lasiosphaeris hirsuta TaxID=260670 RepID=A0AA40DJL4_9PEZI|nr:hypothetical protein B0H67DRAFT_558139 [Lasiosphaeris hirsuta]
MAVLKKFKNPFSSKKAKPIEVEPTSSNVPSHDPTTEYGDVENFGFFRDGSTFGGPTPSLLPIPENGASRQSQQSPMTHQLAPRPMGDPRQSTTSDSSFLGYGRGSVGSFTRAGSVTTTRSTLSSGPLQSNGHLPGTNTADRNHPRGGSSNSTNGSTTTSNSSTSGGFSNTLRSLASRSHNPPPPGTGGVGGPAGTSAHEVKTSAADVRRCTKLLRRMFELRVEAWAMDGAHMTDEPRRLERVRQADLIFVDIQDMVDAWKRAPQSNWSEAEYQEVLWIATTLGDPTWRFGQAAAAPGPADAWRYEQGVAA